MAPNSFDAFWRLGYTRLVPIIPHDADISERSSLYARVGTHQDSRGKAVGVKGQDGKWFGFDWLPHEADERDLKRWQAMQAGIGVKTGQGLILIDADTLDKLHAGWIQKLITQKIGVLPTRIGNFPKAGYLVRVSAPIKYCRIDFGPLTDKNQPRDRVEILSDGRQFVAHGIHPKTKGPYVWPIPLVPFDKLPVVTPQQIVDLLEELRSILPASKPIVTEGATDSVSQASLKGDLQAVTKAVEATPNTSAAFPTREAYRDFGYAIKAALPDHEREAFELYSDWCGRWTDGENDPGIVEADWRRMKPPYRRGAQWLFELAETHSGNAFKRTDAWFEEIPDEPESLFIESLPRLLEDPAVNAPIRWVDPKDWAGAKPPARKWRVEGMIPDGEVTLLTGMGGVGKTLLAQQCATAVAAGLPFLGRNTEQCKVMLFLCEDSEDELNLRQRDICASMGIELDDLSPWLRISSRKYMDNLLAVWTSASAAMKRTAVWEMLRADAVGWGAKLLAVDTIADTFGGSEIDRSQVRQFVQSCLGKLAQEIGGAVLALGHPSKAGQAVGGDGTSGSTAWHASVRSRLYLQHATKDGTGPFRRLENRKANYGASGDVFMLRWLRGAFSLESAKSGAVLDDDTGEARKGATGAIKSMGNAIDDAILEGIESAALEGVAMSKAVNSPHWAPRMLKRHSDSLGIYTVDEIAAGWQRVVEAGRVVVAVVGRKPNRHPVVGFKVVQMTYDETAETGAAGIFD